MTADVLRQAAALMRERAEGATPGPWWQSGAWFDDDGTPMPMVGYGSTGADWVARTRDWSKGDAKHIALWHPAVALAVADWLDYEASWSAPPTHALAVARAYLGESA